MKNIPSQRFSFGALVAFAALSAIQASAGGGGGGVRPLPKPTSVQSSVLQTLTTTNGTKLAVLPSGLALYSFDPDIGAAQPACNDVCAEKWPPVIVDAQEISGIEGLGTIVRASGLNQLTVNGKPVYTYLFDRKLGDIKGNELGGVWHLIKFQ